MLDDHPNNQAAGLLDLGIAPAPKLVFSVSNANSSFSIASSPFQPARFSPKLRPPQPAKTSMNVGAVPALS